MIDIAKSTPSILFNASSTRHPWIGSNPIQHVKELEQQAFKWNLLSKISFVAITAIALSVLAASFFLSATTTVISLSTLFPVIATPFIAYLASQFQTKNMIVQSKIELERPVALAFEQIKEWQSPEIRDFLSHHEISIPSSDIHLPDLIPLIARFYARIEQIKNSNAESDKLLLSSNLPDRELRTWQRNMGWNIRERRTIPAALEAAFVLQILKDPTLRGDLSDHFTLLQKTFEERQFDRLYDLSDTYLVFLKQNKPPMDLEMLMNNLDPDKLSKLL
jgi:hypothetical protein